MIVPEYTPGEWLALVTEGNVALLPPATDPGLVADLWASLRGSGSLSEQLGVLLRGGLAALPPFALLSVHGGRVHAVVRGGVAVEVTTATGVRAVGAPEVSTWTEEVVPDAVTVAVRAPGAVPDGRALPVLSAVVMAAAVVVGLRARTGPVPDAVPTRTPTREAPVAVAGGDRVTATAPAPAREVALDTLAVPSAVPTTRSRLDTAAVARGPLGTDHDGTTVLSSDVVALRRRLPAWPGDAVPAPLTVPAAAAPPAKLRLSSGLVVSLNRPVLLGRAPQAPRTSAEPPRLVTVASPNQDISRTHAEVRMEGEDVLVTDLRSTNGVLLLREEAGPQRLHPGEPTVVEPGVVVDLGEGVTFLVVPGT